MNRRTFLGGLAATGFTIVPRRVLGGQGYTPPSDMILLAQVGCGTQAQRQVNCGMVGRKDLQFVAVVDPNQNSQNYLDWSVPYGNRGRIREFTGEAKWGEGDTAPRAGRDVAKNIIETYYAKNNRPSKGIRAYEDYREMLEKETDIQGVVAITPDHQHASINIAALKKGKAAIAHKPIANLLWEVHRLLAVARESPATSHLLAYSNSPGRHLLAAWIKSGVIGHVKEVHNWTNRPQWPHGMREYYKQGPPIPEGFNWALWQGPEPERIYHPGYTHTVYRGWYAYGAGCLGDMGHYSLWQPYRILNLGIPEWVETTASHTVQADLGNRRETPSQVAFPHASSMRWHHPATADRPAVDTFWYDGGMRPQTPDELLVDNQSLEAEGMLFVGEKGKILCDFRGSSTPRLIPASRQAAFEGQVEAGEFDRTSAEDEWANAIRKGTKSNGRFENVAALAYAVSMASIALRQPYKRLHFNLEKMEFSEFNAAKKVHVRNEAATKLIKRENQRPEWDKLIG
jgi:hypothetical protein